MLLRPLYALSFIAPNAMFHCFTLARTSFVRDSYSFFLVQHSNDFPSNIPRRPDAPEPLEIVLKLHTCRVMNLQNSNMDFLTTRNDDVLIHIGSFLQHPSDKLHFTTLNRRTPITIAAIGYSNIRILLKKSELIYTSSGEDPNDH